MLSARKKIKQEAVQLALKELQKFIEKPLKKGNGATGGDQARYGAVLLTSDGLQVKGQQHPCHAYMKNYANPLVVFNQYSHRKGDILPEADEAYFSWITSDDGPWKDFPNRLISEGDDEIFQTGWVWTNLDVPSNLQHSFLTAGRMAAEWPELINLWHQLTEKYSLNPAMTFLFISLFNKNDKKFVINHINKYDWPVDVCTGTESYVRNFCQGKVSGLNKNYSKDQRYTPVNAIFGRHANSTEVSYPKLLHKMYAGKIGVSEKECKEFWDKKGTGFSGYNYMNHWYVYEKELAEIIQLETERLLDA